MLKRSFLLLVICCLAPLIITTEVRSGQEVQDIIRFDNKAYKTHKKGIAVFNHKIHYEEYYKKYPELYSSPCGECHHDKDNKKLDHLKLGDEVQSCIECHKKPDYIKGKKAKGLSKEQKREFHANALHYNCKDCHRKYNKARKLKSKDKGYAPNTCKTCHPQNKK